MTVVLREYRIHSVSIPTQQSVCYVICVCCVIFWLGVIAITDQVAATQQVAEWFTPLVCVTANMIGSLPQPFFWSNGLRQKRMMIHDSSFTSSATWYLQLSLHKWKHLAVQVVHLACRTVLTPSLQNPFTDFLPTSRFITHSSPSSVKHYETISLSLISHSLVHIWLWPLFFQFHHPQLSKCLLLSWVTPSLLLLLLGNTKLPSAPAGFSFIHNLQILWKFLLKVFGTTV